MVCICFKREGLIFPLLQKEGELSALILSSILSKKGNYPLFAK